ncbi:hypothetical protein BD410DRAFT_752095 [Rickenella mellea]|uniref:Ubiquinol-cytochrome c chaperone domain-containing protein n=1 Tax=Rickenella mellea TaxID=50990 RepID=A0A4Y7PWY3_9AGAM|nr:hypothetical protein BD410DRAFT_752095 [Rickenella mellea]
MLARRRLIQQAAAFRLHARLIVTPPPRQPYNYQPPTPPPETWLTTYLKKNPRAMRVFEGFTSAIGINSPKQVAGRQSYVIYQNACATREAAELDFWHQKCRLPPTFQSWFTVTNLHVWMLTVRLRALPPPHGTYYVQALVDHFFLDVEDRIRAVLSKKAPERLVTRQMKIFREQWAGLGLSFDYALALSSPHTAPEKRNGDVEMAAAVWRNLLGARGANGITESSDGAVVKRSATDTDTEMPKVQTDPNLEQFDDGSGMHDFMGEDTRLYVMYPELMVTIITYIRRELIRLEAVRDEQITQGHGVGLWGSIQIQ